MSDLLETPVVYTSSSEEFLLSSSSNTQTVTTTATHLPHQKLLYSDNISVLDICGRGKEETEKVDVLRCSSLLEEESSSCRNILCILCFMCCQEDG